jgi:hypothetical protein
MNTNQFTILTGIPRYNLQGIAERSAERRSSSKRLLQFSLKFQDSSFCSTMQHHYQGEKPMKLSILQSHFFFIPNNSFPTIKAIEERRPTNQIQ